MPTPRAITRLAAAGLIVALATGAVGQVTTWTAGTGSWTSAANWNNGVPTIAKPAQINNGGTVTLSTAGAVAASLTLGAAGTGGTLTIQTGGTLSTATSGEDVIAGGKPGAVTVTGAGSGWTMGDSLVVGYGSTGSLTLADGATATTLIFASVGYQSVATGTVTITGSGSHWSLENLFLGDSGTGTLNLAAGGRLTLLNGTGTLDVAYASGSSGTVNLGTGGGAGVLDAAALQFRQGQGVLNFNHADSGYVFANTGGTGIAIAGAGAVRQIGSGTTILTGTATHTGGTTVKAGTLEVRGSLSHAGVDLRVGDVSGDNGTLRAAQGGDIATAHGHLGHDAGATGAAEITGAGSTWTSDGNLYVGRSGTGTLTVSGGGTVANTHAFLGFNAGATGTATVTGSGSAWTNSGDVLVGYAGTGNLTVSAGGAAASTFAILGHEGTGAGTATVTGSGSSLTVDNDFLVGRSGTGTFTIAAGGSVTATSGNTELGTNAGSSGTLNVTGSGSILHALEVNVGYEGTGVLTLADGGRVRVDGGTGTIHVAGAPGSTGTVNLGAPQAGTAAGPGVFDADTLQFGPGTGQLQFKHTSADYTFANQAGTPVVLAGAGSVRQSAGVTTLAAASTHTGTTTVAGGTLRISAENNLGANPAAFAASQLNLAGGTLQTTASFTLDDANRGVTLATATTSTISPDAGTTFTLATPVAGPGNLAKAGAGTLVLASANTFSGAVTPQAGTLRLAHSLALQDAQLNVSAGGGAVTFDGITAATVRSLQGNGELVLTNNAAAGVTLSIASSAGSTFTGNLAGAGGVSFSGPGYLDLQGGASLTGNLHVAGEVLLAGPSFTFGTLSGTGAGYLWLEPATTLTLSGGNSTYGGNLDGEGVLAKTGGGDLEFTGTTDFTGTVRIENGWLKSTQGDALRFATVEAVSDYAIDLYSPATVTIGGLSGSGYLEGEGPIMSLRGNGATYAGHLVVDWLGSDGELRVTHGTQTFTGRIETPATRIDGTALFTGGSQHSLGTTRIAAGELRASGDGTQVATGSLLLQTEPAAAGSLVRVTDDALLTVNGPLTVALAGDTKPAILQADAGGSLVATGALDVAAPGAITADGGSVRAASANVAGPVTLTDGVLVAAGGITLAAGGSISGHGVIVGDVTNTGGTFAIASPTGTVHLVSPLAVGAGTARVYSTGTPHFNNAISVAAGGAIDTPFLDLGSAAALTTAASLTNRIAGAAGSTITATANVTLGEAGHASGFATAGTLHVGTHTVTLASAGVADLGTTVLGGGGVNGGGVLVAPAAGIRLQAGDTISGNGFIRGPILDETGGTAFAPANASYPGSLAVGADTVAMLGSAVLSSGLTIAGGSIAPVSTEFAHSQLSVASLSGHGTVAGRITVSGAAATLLTLDGDLAIDGSGYAAPQLQGGKTYAVGPHTLSLPAGATRTGAGALSFALADGRIVLGGDSGLLSSNQVALAGSGLLLASSPQHYQPGSVTLTPDAALSLAGNLAVGAQMAVFSSNASVALGTSTTLAGGMLHSPAGFTLDGSDTILGHGLVHGAITDNTAGAGGLSATGVFAGGATVFGLGAGTVHVLSTDEAVFTFADSARSGALTLVAPNGVSLERSGSASVHPLTVHGDLAWRGGATAGPLSVTGDLTAQGATFSGAVAVGGTFEGSGLFADGLSAAAVVPAGTASIGAFVQGNGAATRFVADGLVTTGSDVTLAGGTFTADRGVRFGPGTALRGAGTFTGYAAGGAGNIEGVTGNLTVDATGAAGTVAFDTIFHTGSGATVTILADAPVAIDNLTLDAGTGFSATNGAAAAQASLGWGWLPGGPPVTVQGPLTISEITLANGPLDTAGLTAGHGPLYYDTLVRGVATLGTGSGTVTGHGTFHRPVTLLTSAQVDDFDDNLFLDVAASSLNPGRLGEAGLLAFSQNLVLSGNTTLTLELGGLARGTGYDAFTVGGAFTVAGTLTLSLINGFVPAAGDSFDLYDHSTASGTFATLELPALAPGLSWDTTGLYTLGTVAITGAAVPEPSTCAALAGAAALGAAAWRRRRTPAASATAGRD